MLSVLPLVEFSKVFTTMIVTFLSLPRFEKECYKMRRYNIFSSMLGEPIITSSFSGCLKILLCDLDYLLLIIYQFPDLFSFL